MSAAPLPPAVEARGTAFKAAIGISKLLLAAKPAPLATESDSKAPVACSTNLPTPTLFITKLLTPPVIPPGLLILLLNIFNSFSCLPVVNL